MRQSQRNASRRGRPATLSKEMIVAAAIESGTDQLTVRQLAQRLGVAHSALYRWVGGREELLDLVSDTLLERVATAMDEQPSEWRGWLTALARELRASFLPLADGEGLAQFPRTTRVYAGLRERAESVLREGGMAPQEAADTYLVFLFSVWGWLAAERACPQLMDHDRHFSTMVDALIRGLATDTGRETGGGAAS